MILTSLLLFVSLLKNVQYNIVNFCLVIIVFVVFIRNSSGTNFGPSHSKAVICYLATYAEHRPGRGSFRLEDLNPSLCTHLIYAFALLNETNDSIQLLGSWSDLKVNVGDGQNNISKLKKTYPHLKVSVALGGWQDGSVKYSNMVANSDRRNKFVNNSVEFLKKQNLDGLDLVWMYPSKRGGRKEDKLNYVELIKNLRREFDKNNLLLTAFLACSKDTIDYGYQVSEITKYLDYAIMMCYDFHGIWAHSIGHSAPLFNRGIYSAAYSINYMLKLGAKSNKLVLAVPSYGRTFIAEERINLTVDLPGLQQRIKNYTFGGPLTEEEGLLGYNEICLELKNSTADWKVYWDNSANVPFAISGDKFISYDNDVSVKVKTKFAVEKKLGGIALWSVDTDDFRGDCGEIIDGNSKFPLLSSINKEFNVLSEMEHEDNLLETKTEIVKSLESYNSSSININPHIMLLKFLIIFILFN